MTYDILISRPRTGTPTQTFMQHLKTYKTEKGARDFVRNLANLPADTTNYVITCDDGRTIHDSSRDGIIR